MKTTPCTDEKHYAFKNAPRCLAKTRQGAECQSPAVHGKRRCRMHGCGKGSGAPMANQNAFRHGRNTTIVKGFRKTVRQVLKNVDEYHLSTFAAEQ